MKGALYLLQLVLNPPVVLVVLLTVVFTPLRSLLGDFDGINAVHLRAHGVVVMLGLVVGLSLALFHARTGRWWAPEVVSPYMLPANAIVAAALWTSIVDGMEGNVVAFMTVPLGVVVFYWFMCLRPHRPVAPSAPGPGEPR